MIRQNDLRHERYKVYSKRLASKLCKMGFRIVDTEPNNNKPWLNIFLFENSIELQEAISNLIDSEGGYYEGK